MKLNIFLLLYNHYSLKRRLLWLAGEKCQCQEGGKESVNPVHDRTIAQVMKAFNVFPLLYSGKRMIERVKWFFQGGKAEQELKQELKQEILCI